MTEGRGLLEAALAVSADDTEETRRELHRAALLYAFKFIITDDVLEELLLDHVVPKDRN